jgi:hypothetical protein
MNPVKTGETYIKEKTMEKIVQHGKRIWGLAVANKRVTAVVIVAIIIVISLIK